VTYVLDACALIAYFRKERGGELVQELLLDSSSHFYIHALNLCEVYYDFVRSDGEETANRLVQVLIEIGIIVQEDIDPAIWKIAGKYKASLKKISLADAFAIALSNRFDAKLVTSDHSEFDKVAEQGLCDVLFIR
jgi:PIN domain nuclease of toxin-antitoxin system